MFQSSSLNERNCNFQWSLQPILTWMQIVGIDLSLTSNKLKRYISLSYGLFMGSMAIISQSREIFQTIVHAVNSSATIDTGAANEKKDVNSVTKIRIINESIMHFQSCISAVGILMSIFMVAQFQWKSLWKCLSKLERFAGFGTWLFFEIRKISNIGVLWLSVVSNC